MRGIAVRSGVLALCLSAALALTGCAVSLFPSARTKPTPAPTAATVSASRLADSAVNAWGKGQAERFQGTFSASGIPLSVDVTLAFGSGGDGLGQGTANSASFQYLSSGGTTYLKGQAFWQAYYTGQSQQQLLAKGYGENYTVATGNNVALAIQQLPSLGGAVEQLSSEEASVQRGGLRTINGHQAVALTEGGTTWWVTVLPPVTLVGLQSPAQGGLQSLNVTMQTSRTPTDLTSQLGSAVDPSNPSTMPALYQVTDVEQQDQSNCTNVVCGFNVTVVNQEGPAAGQGVVTVSTYANETSTTVLADCTANIPMSLGTNQSTVIQCGVSGPGWEGYAGTDFYVRAVVTTNPPYL